MKSNRKKNAIMISGIAVLAVLALLATVGTASAAITLNVTHINVTRGAATTTLSAFNATIGAAGDVNTDSDVRLMIDSGTGMTFNLSTASLNQASCKSNNITRLGHGSIDTDKCTATTLYFNANKENTATVDWTISNIDMILTEAATANSTLRVRGAVYADSKALDLVPLAPNVARSGAAMNVTAGNNTQELKSGLMLNSTSDDPNDLYHWINLTIDRTDTNVTFDTSKNVSIINDVAGDAVDISNVLRGNYSNNDKTVSLWINNSAANVGDGINITGLYVNVSNAVTNGTVVNILVNTTPENGYEICADSTSYNFTVWTPRISYYPGPTNNNVTACNNTQLLDSGPIINSTVANDLGLGEWINLTIDTTYDVTFDTSKNGSIVNAVGSDAVDISNVLHGNYSSDHKTVGLYINALVGTVDDGINISGLYVNVSCDVPNGTVMNVSVYTTPKNGSLVPIVSTLYNFTVWTPSIFKRATDDIFVDNLGIVNCTINYIAINSTVDNDIGNNTFINLSLLSGPIRFVKEWIGITATNKTGGSLNVNLSSTLKDIDDYMMRIPVNSSSNVGNWVNISGINVTIPSAQASAMTTGNHTHYINVTTMPFNGTCAATLNATGVNLTVIKLAPDGVNNVTANKSAKIGTAVPLTFNVTNSTYGKTFGGKGVTFEVDDTSYGLSPASGTTDIYGNVSVTVTLPSAMGSANITAYLTDNANINDTIRVNATAGPVTGLLVTHDGPKLKSNVAWENNMTVIVYAVDAGGNKNNTAINSVTLTVTGTAVVNDTAAVAMVAGVAAWDVYDMNAESVTLTATSPGLTTGTNDTEFTEPVTGITVTATPISITADKSNTTIKAQLTGATGDVHVAGVNITFTSMNATLALFGNFTLGTTCADTVAGGYAEVNLTSNTAGTTGSVQIQATALGKMGSTPVDITAALSYITVSPSTWTLNVSETKEFSATANYSDGTSTTIDPAWSSSNTTVGTITTSGGVLTALKMGTTTITATYNSETNTSEVTVNGVLSVTANESSVITNTLTPVLFNVTDSDDIAVPGANVNLTGVSFEGIHNGTTDANGSVTIPVNATSVGTITVTASKTGYIDGTDTIEARTTGVVKGDFDGDGDIDFDDFVEFAGAYGATTCADANYNPIADFDDDCDVDFDDFVEFAGVYTG